MSNYSFIFASRLSAWAIGFTLWSRCFCCFVLSFTGTKDTVTITQAMPCLRTAHLSRLNQIFSYFKREIAQFTTAYHVMHLLFSQGVLASDKTFCWGHNVSVCVWKKKEKHLEENSQWIVPCLQCFRNPTRNTNQVTAQKWSKKMSMI